MKKIYVLDTNVMLHDPLSLFQFQEHDVVIPAIVLEELDGKKRNMDEVGRNARETARILDQLRETGQLHAGVPLGNGGILRVDIGDSIYEGSPFTHESNDNKIIELAWSIHREQQTEATPRDVILVSKDILVRVKADAYG